MEIEDIIRRERRMFGDVRPAIMSLYQTLVRYLRLSYRRLGGIGRNKSGLILMTRNSKSTEEPKLPIYPPDKNKAIFYWSASFASFCAAAFFGDFFLVMLTGITMAASSAYVGEQLYKTNVYKEILYYRALYTMMDINEREEDV